MTQLSPRPGATGTGRQRTQAIQRLSRDELPRVRAAATAWRNGIAALLAGLLGFSLIKGRSDIDKLAMPWRGIVGGLLLAALIIGAYGAVQLLWASHGRPRSVPRHEVHSRLAADHEEATTAQRAMLYGIAASLACAGLLVSAVGMTWYGPPAAEPKLRVVVGGETLCGSVVRADAGTLTLETDAGERTINLTHATGFKPVETCG